ncbi:MAG: DMT family transporter, partial [Chromatiales bacterium]|nr:DMT family transporter [Chromatiales bacterium]
LRFVTASIILLFMLYAQSGSLPRLNRQQFGYIFLLGLSGITIYNLFFFFGLQHVEAGRGALIITSNPIWVALGSVLFFNQRLNLSNLSGLLFCLIGVSVVLSKGHPSDLLLSGIGSGELALLTCAISWAAYTLLGRQLMHSEYSMSPLTLVTYSSISGSMMIALWMMFSGQKMDFTPTVTLLSSIGYLSILGTVVGFIWFFQGVQRIGAAQSAVFVFFVPVSAIILGYLWLDEAITISLVIGAFMIISGVALVNKKSKNVKP